MKTKLTIQLLLGMTLSGFVCLAQDVKPPAGANSPSGGGAVESPTPPGANEVDNIKLAPMPLPKVIQTLASGAGIKIMFDPKLQQGTNVISTNIIDYIDYQGVTSRQVLDAVLKNNDLVLMPDTDTGIARVTRRDPKAVDPPVTRVYQLKYSNVTNMVVVVSNAVSTVRVVANSRTSQLVLTGNTNDLAAVESLIDELDSPTRQVLIEAQIYETNSNPKSKKGIDWTGTLDNQVFTFGNGRTSGETVTTTPGGSTTSSTTLPSGRVLNSTTTSPSSSSTALSTLLGSGGLSVDTLRGFYPHTAFLNAQGVSAALSFLNTDSDTELVATPRAVTLDNEPAVLSVTEARPIFKVTPGTSQTPAGSEVTYTNVGVILTVTPHISASDEVSMRIVPEVSEFGPQDTQVVNGQQNTANTFVFRKIETKVVIPNGHTLVMGGLIQDSRSKTYTKVPILGDLPAVGLAFRHESKERKKKNLIIFITPNILSGEDYQTSESNFLKTRRVEKPEPKESAWDTGKPRDWTKPVE